MGVAAPLAPRPSGAPRPGSCRGCISPVGLMPESTRAKAGDATGAGPGPSGMPFRPYGPPVRSNRDALRGPHPGVRGTVRPPAAPDPPPGGRALGGLARRDRRRVPPRARAHAGRRHGRLDLDVATEFLLIAATLVELKARRLLPGLEDVELDEELLRFEERDLLLARLLECKTFKDVAAAFELSMRRADRSLPRRMGPEEPFLLARARSARAGAARPPCARRRCACSRPRPSRWSTPSTSRRSGPASATRSRPCCASCPPPSR